MSQIRTRLVSSFLESRKLVKHNCKAICHNQLPLREDNLTRQQGPRTQRFQLDYGLLPDYKRKHPLSTQEGFHI